MLIRNYMLTTAKCGCKKKAHSCADLSTRLARDLVSLGGEFCLISSPLYRAGLPINTEESCKQAVYTESG